jgi:crossover junction endodeoxyribonuclease RuvC
MIIIGIDPGSRITGYGIIESNGRTHKHLASGCIKLGNKDFPLRLKDIFINLNQIIQLYQPTKAAIEQVFTHKNSNSAIKLGQARGAAITALAMNDIEIVEYSPRGIKQAITGYGAADKKQVQFMVKALLKLKGELQADTADALAIALYAAYMNN